MSCSATSSELVGRAGSTGVKAGVVAAREVVAAAMAWLKVTDGMLFTETLDEAAGATLS